MKEPINIPSRPAEAPPAGLSLGDLYYIFFRHKGKILLIFLLGLAGAAGFYLFTPVNYVSEAKILIRYVLDTQATAPTTGSANDQKLTTPDSMGKTIISSEVEILTSYDLVNLVAELVGPEKILAKMGGGTNRAAAAGVIARGLRVEVPTSSSVLRIGFGHPDPTVVQPVLSQLLDTYLKRHVEIRQGVGVLDDFFTRQADQSRARLSNIEADLKQRKAEAGVFSLEEDLRAAIAQQNNIEQNLGAAIADHAEQVAMLKKWEEIRPGRSAVAQVETGVPPEVANRYLTVGAELESLEKQLVELRRRFTDEHWRVKLLIEEVAQMGTQKQTLEQQYTNLTVLMPPPLKANAEVDLTTQILRVAALEKRIEILTNHLETARSNAGRIRDSEQAINQLERQRNVEEAKLNYYSASLERARNSELLGAGKITNIKSVQDPTPPARDTQNLKKPLALMLAFGLLGGFGLAFLIERVLNQRIRRLSDLERLVRAPVFVTVPDLGWKKARQPKLVFNADAPAASGSEAVNGNGAAHVNGVNGKESAEPPVRPAEVAPWDSRHLLRSYYEGLRDRLITYFEVRNLTHKPKLVAVTSCRHGAGVTTMAAGLAATLSETGDGNVLLVDMNLEHGAAHQFYQGKPGCALSEALENSTREPAQVQENLYLVTAHETKNQKLPRVLPKRFAHLIPRMKASDYDYIIFDMPPISQTSVTPRLAGLMDMVLVVVESETTGQEIVKRAHDLLGESRATVATVLNKHRSYLPERFNQEL